MLSPPGTLGGEVAAVATLDAQAVAGGDETTLAAPDGWGFAAGSWVWEDDQTLIAVLQPLDGTIRSSRLARCDVTLGACTSFRAPGDDPSETTISERPDPGTAQEFTAESALDDIGQAVAAADRRLLLDQRAIGDVEWQQLVGWAAGGGASEAGCRDNGGGTQDCEIALAADPATTYYVILEPAGNAYGWRLTYAGIAHD